MRKKNNTTGILRSNIMRAVRSENTRPEKQVRKLLRLMRFKFRANQKNLPGKPDFVFYNRRKIVFVNGCFWHGHQCKRGNRIPKTNTIYWKNKIEKNRKRDRKIKSNLRSANWATLDVWECEINPNNLVSLKKRLERFLRK